MSRQVQNIVPESAHSIEQKDMVAHRAMFLLRYLGLADSITNRMQIEDRMYQRFEAKYGRSNLTDWRLCQLSNEELTSLICEPVSAPQPRSVRVSILRPVLH